MDNVETSKKEDAKTKMKDKETKDGKSDMKDDKEIQDFKKDKTIDLMNEMISFD
jgi:hypothetical protein